MTDFLFPCFALRREMTSKKKKMVMFTSLPKVGGHSTLTLGLCRLFSAWFSEIEVWVKVMPEHGHSVDAQKALEQQGFRVVVISNEKGHIKPLVIARAVLRSWLRPPQVFFALAMRNLSLVLRLLMFGSRGVYFHITHDLNQRTSRWLGFVEKIFSKLVFICPATFQDYGSRSPRCSWAPQASELAGIEIDEVVASKKARAERTPRRVSFGLSGRLTREKGAEAVLQFIKVSDAPCDFHIAGGGPFEGEFKRLALEGSDDGPRVFFHGTYAPTERLGFLRNFFGKIDWLLVPSIDEWETLSMVTLEALQYGTPVLCSRAGGLRSFGMPELGPAPAGVIDLFDPESLGAEINKRIASPVSQPDAVAVSCREHYSNFFSDHKVTHQWRTLLHS